MLSLIRMTMALMVYKTRIIGTIAERYKISAWPLLKIGHMRGARNFRKEKWINISANIGKTHFHVIIFGSNNHTTPTYIGTQQKSHNLLHHIHTHNLHIHMHTYIRADARPHKHEWHEHAHPTY
jgi:hypothetical protein